MKIAFVQGSTNGTNGIPISFKVLPMEPLVIPLVPMVSMVPLVPLVSQWYHWLPMVPLGEPRTEPVYVRDRGSGNITCGFRGGGGQYIYIFFGGNESRSQSASPYT